MCFSFKLWCFLCTPIEFTHFPNRLHSFHCVSTDNHWRPTPARLWADGDPCCGWKQGMFFTLRIFYNFPMIKHITITTDCPGRLWYKNGSATEDRDRQCWVSCSERGWTNYLISLRYNSVRKEIFSSSVCTFRWRMSYWTILSRLMVPVLLCA